MDLPDEAIEIHKDNYAKVLAGLPDRAVVELTMAMEDAASDYADDGGFDDITSQVRYTLGEGFRKVIEALNIVEDK